jgi:UDP-N-acetylglucosamine acyltransferase
MRRAGINLETRTEIKHAYKILYRSGLNISNALEQIKKECKSAEVKHFVKFIEESKRGIIRAARETGDRRPETTDQEEDII